MELAQIAQTAQQAGGLTLLTTALALGFRHGIDWDHIAAITDITSTTSASHTEADVPAGAPMPAHGHEPDELRGHEHAHEARGPGAMHVLAESRFAHEERHAIGLATLYALGHALVVLVLGVTGHVVRPRPRVSSCRAGRPGAVFRSHPAGVD